MSWMRDSSDAAAPKARTEHLLVEQVDDETVVYDLHVKQVHCLGPLAAVVFGQCDGRASAAEIALVASERTGSPVTGSDVAAAIAELEGLGLLERPVLQVRDGLSRRDMVRKSALVGSAAFAAPLITSIAAPTAAMALSGIPTGCTGCGKNPDCVSNHCCQSVAGKQCNQSCCVANNNSCRLREVNGVNVCSVLLAGCGSVVCPPGSSKCCSTT